MDARTTLVIFARSPTAGPVKTRLCPPLTARQAGVFQHVCIEATAGLARGFPADATRWRVTPDDACTEFRRMVGNGPLVEPQGPGDLGERLARATRQAFAGGAERVLLIGTDCPLMPDDTLASAAQALDAADAVLGPCEDGGYYLLGLRAYVPRVFERIAWGGPTVADQTRERLAAAGVKLAELPLGYDLDRPADLRRAARDLNGRDIPRRLWPLRDFLKTMSMAHE